MNVVQVLNMFAMMTSFALPQAESGYVSHYSTEKEAVTAAANTYNPLSIREDREYMGAIYKTRNGFKFSVTAGKRRSDTVQISIPDQEFDSVVAFWHTHGNADPVNRYFSNTDTQTVNKFGRPLYLADYTGYLKVFEPGDKTMSRFSARRLGLPSITGYATGDLVKDRNQRPIRIATKLITAFS